MDKYTEIDSPEELERVLQESQDHPVLIFKHSTRCPISARAFTAYCDFAGKDDPQPVSCYVLKVIEERALSNRIAEELGVEHHSPQAILVHNRKPVWVATHWDITVDALSKACEK